MPVRFSTSLVALSVLVLSGPAWGHELHDGHQHVNYRSWINQAGKGCCNDRDCRPLKDADVRLSPVTMVRIEGQWCEVKSKHYLKSGNAPDWQSNHACVELNTAKPPCERLLCFQPTPLF